MRAHFGGQGSRGARRRAAIVFFLFLATASAVLVRVAEPATSAITTATLVPVADAYVDGSTPSTNYGADARVVVDGSPVRQTLLRFDLSSFSGPVQNARLRLHVANVAESQSTNAGTVARVTDNGWVEGGVTYANRPTVWGTSAASFGAVSRNTWVDVPVTAAVVAGGLVTLGVRTADWDGAYFDSRQTGATSPQLIVTAESTATTSSSTTTTTTTTEPDDDFEQHDFEQHDFE